MEIRNGLVDEMRENLKEDLIQKNVSAEEWFFIKQYIDQQFEQIQNKARLKNNYL